MLDLIPTLIDCLIGQITFPELAELLSFLGLLVAKYKANFTSILDTLLLPVFNRVFHFLQLDIAGTDDQVQHSTLKRAYFNFIITICGAGLQEVFYSESKLSLTFLSFLATLADSVACTLYREPTSPSINPSIDHSLHLDERTRNGSTLRFRSTLQTRHALGRSLPSTSRHSQISNSRS